MAVPRRPRKHLGTKEPTPPKSLFFLLLFIFLSQTADRFGGQDKEDAGDEEKESVKPKVRRNPAPLA